MPQASVLVVDDEELIRWSLQRDLGKMGYSVSVAASGTEALQLHTVDPADVVLLDIHLPDGSGVALIGEFLARREDSVVIMITSETAIETAVQSMQRGAWDYVTKPFDFTRLYSSLAKAVERVNLREENRALRIRQSAVEAPSIVAESASMRQVLDLAGKVAATDTATVLLRGESGVGKDLLAHHIHQQSARSTRLFLDINCAAMPEALLESELFGHERGAFTDAKSQKRGLLEMAEGGTVFLDEIGDAPVVVQAKLLKLLEQRSFRRLGGLRDITSNVRVIAATNRDLDAAVTERRFREDLYYRLKVFPIVIPPLRERREDILPMARALLAGYIRSFRKPLSGLTPEAERCLLAYHWPGNVRELRNVIERAVILAPVEAAVAADLLPVELGSGMLDDEPTPMGALIEAEIRLIREALAAHGGNQSRAAGQLGISRDALRRRMRRFGLGQEPDE